MNIKEEGFYSFIVVKYSAHLKRGYPDSSGQVHMASIFCTGESPFDNLNIHFYMDREKMPLNWVKYSTLEDGTISHNAQLSLPIERYDSIIHMLQNNSPVYAAFFESDVSRTSLKTINQPIAESQRPRNSP